MHTLTRSTILSLLFLVTLAAETTNTQAQVRIVHIDVGQGDATLVVGPERTLLFDAGVTGSGAAIRRVLDSLEITSLDYFVAGHYHADHIGAIDEVIGGGIALNIASYDRGGSYTSTAYTQYVAAAVLQILASRL